MASLSSLPTEKTEEQKLKRMEMFKSFDPNGNGYLSLAECDKGMVDLGWDVPKPVTMRAFQVAKSYAQEQTNSTSGVVGESFIERSEFRIFLLYLSRYMELWKTFRKIDSGGDRRLDETEFQSAVQMIQSSWGITIEDPTAEFQKMDKNNGGMILFDEFCAWGLPLSIKSSECME